MTNDDWTRDINWVDLDEAGESSKPEPKSPNVPKIHARIPIVTVETAFLASTASLLWLINYYFPLGPLLRIFFPIPIALVYLRRGSRAAWMSAFVAGLLLSILMGPNRSIMFVMPFGVMGVQLGAFWRRGMGWYASIATGALLGVIGFFFRFWLLSFLLGEDLWLYVINQMTKIADWIFLVLGLLDRPEPMFIQTIALATIALQNVVYLFVVHLVALLLFDRLGNPIPRPPDWVQALVEYDY